MAMRSRVKIRAPRRTMATKGSDFESTWRTLSSSFREIHTKNASKLSFEELYRCEYNLTLQKQGEELYNKVCEFEREWLGNDVCAGIVTAISPSLLVGDSVESTDMAMERIVAGDRFIVKLKEAWEHYELCMGMINDVLMYMDKSLTNEKKKPPIYTMAMRVFRDSVLNSSIGGSSEKTILNVLQDTILYMIHLERDGNSIDRSLIRRSLGILESLHSNVEDEEPEKLYFVTFEPAFLEASKQFYFAEGRRLLSSVDAASFCRQVAQRLREEEARCQFELASTSEPRVKSVIDDFLIMPNIAEVIKMPDSGAKHMLDNDRFADLRNLYELVSRVESQKPLFRDVVYNRVVDLGTVINAAASNVTLNAVTVPQKSKETTEGKEKEKEKPPVTNLQTSAAIKWVDDILQLKEKFERILTESFNDDHDFQATLTSSLTYFINSNPRSSEYLSLFFDENLKKGIKGKSDEEIDNVLERGITLLRYITDKDLFEIYYKKHLSRRLLMKRSISMDAERQMISKMKMEVGNAFTQKLEAMFKDMATSADTTAAYKKHISEIASIEKPIELEIQVLTSMIWPLEMMKEADPRCIYPPRIQQLKDSFEQFYLQQHNGRKLSWQLGMGTADIRAAFPRPNGKLSRHELNVSTYAMFILLLFNDLPADQSLSFEEIQARTNIPAHDLIRNLQSLAVAPKTRVLKKEPMSKDIKSTDRFFFNESFNHQYLKIKIGVVSAGNRVENVSERKETEDKTDKERGHMIEAAVVRTMKQRRTLSHSQLLSEVISQLSSRFNPDVSMLKKRIESLIDREYLERVPDSNPPAYSYVA